ncbi:MAG TPA: 30S ribosome-binding factor RbfA [Planctomycetaceae bacterium]|nr:30S ribosome-binding factor RbfA [Planctomycetaceae bacterium]HCK55816.1 30S ribosome-binding factor RbfA [Planctomycetaceae bacterium]|tara:strand:+ start:81 stop:470 length:390 start_codon:yes stop_codon:yes gene_type:complete
MTARRLARMAQAIRESVSSAILFELKDPRVQDVTVVGVDVAGDLRSARVRVTVRGDGKAQALSLHGLRSARGFLQSKIADRLKTRYTPMLEFALDDEFRQHLETARLLSEIEKEQSPANEPSSEVPTDD